METKSATMGNQSAPPPLPHLPRQGAEKARAEKCADGTEGESGHSVQANTGDRGRGRHRRRRDHTAVRATERPPTCTGWWRPLAAASMSGVMPSGRICSRVSVPEAELSTMSSTAHGGGRASGPAVVRGAGTQGGRCGRCIRALRQSLRPRDLPTELWPLCVSARTCRPAPVCSLPFSLPSFLSHSLSLSVALSLCLSLSLTHSLSVLLCSCVSPN